MSLGLAAALAVLVAGTSAVLWSIGRIRGDLAQAESRLARRFYKLQGQVTDLEATVRELDFEHKRRRGEIRFTAETTLGQALSVHPRVGEILAAFGLTGSGCSGGGLNEAATLARACSDSHVDLRAVLQALAAFVENPDSPVSARPETAKLYRIERPK
jgi:hypothetical protein